MDKNQQFQQDIKHTLDRQTLSKGTRNVLQAARISALNNDTQTRVPAWIPATVLSSLAVVIVGVLLYGGVNEVEFPQAAVDDLAVIASEDEFELLEELEFYVWFDQDQNV